MHCPDATLVKPPKASRRIFALAVAVLGLVYFVVEQDFRKSSLADYALSSEEMESSVESGNAVRQLAFASIGVLGFYLLFHKEGRPLTLNDPLAVLISLLLAWCVASVAWSSDMALTAKRVVVLCCCFVGMLGISRHFSVGQLHLMATAILLTFVLAGIGTEVILGTFRPWSGDYRFAGTAHPNSQGIYCATLALATATSLSADRKKGVPIAIFILSTAMLLLTRSRAACAGLAAALAALHLLKMSTRAKIVLAVGGAWLASTLTFAWGCSGAGIDLGLSDYLLLGRTEDASSLSGRIPLWTELLGYVEQRPILGYGYDSFWTARHIEDVSAVSDWTVYVAHSFCLDAVLSIGVVGLVLLLSCAALGMYRLASRYRATGESGFAFLFGMLILGGVGGLMESMFLQPMFVPFVVACGIGQVAFRPLNISQE
ncbi:MAG: O-antigen ligase family protein [Thermoguttaceae bacterium]